MGLGDRVNRRLDLAAKRNAAVFDAETQQWRYPDDDLSTGYRVAEGVSWLGSVGIMPEQSSHLLPGLVGGSGGVEPRAISLSAAVAEHEDL